MPSHVLEDSALADMDKPTQAEKLRRVRALREMGEKLDNVITQFVVESKQTSSSPSLPEDCLLLREHLQLSPRYYDTFDRCVSVRIYGRMQHRLIDEYHEKPQLWMSPDILADFRMKISKKVKKKWCTDET